MYGANACLTFVNGRAAAAVRAVGIVGMAIADAMTHFMSNNRDHGVDVPGIQVTPVHQYRSIRIATGGRKTG